jgi:MFS family permease
MASSSMVMLTISAWAPTYLMRSFGMGAGEIGLTYGLLALIFGLLGTAAAPLISRQLARWSPVPTMQTVRAGPFMLVAFSIALASVSSKGLALAILGLLTFSYYFPMSMASTSLQLATPSRLRGVASAYYFVIVSLVGYGVGPTAVPLVAQYVLHDPTEIGRAMGVISATFGVLAIVLLSIAVGAFRRELAAESNPAA